MERNIDRMATTVRTLEPTADLDVLLVEQLTKDETVLSKRPSDIVDDILSLSEDDAESLERASTLEGTLRTLSLKLKKLAHVRESSTTAISVSASFGVKLPKISVPTLNGNIIEWRNIWEQFLVSIHKKDHLSHTEKLAYLKDALKDGPARTAHVIQGLAQTAGTSGPAP